MRDECADECADEGEDECADECALIVFAKAPIAGYAKTRLARFMGAEAAARLSSRMLIETLTHAIDAGIGPVELCCTPDATHPEFERVALACGIGLGIGIGIDLTLQGDGDLGARMERALTRGLRAHRSVLLIGTDAPALDAACLRDAAAALQTHAAVFVPAVDGGYVLVGLTVGLNPAMPALFEGIAWGSSQVMAQTRERLRAIGIDAAELPAVHDVDEPEDLVHVPKAWLALLP